MAEEIFICPEGSYERVDKILAQAFPKKSRALIQKAIEEKKVRRKDGSFLESKTKINSGDELIIDLTREDTISLKPRNIPLEVLYEDDQILVCLLYTSDAADDLTRVDLGGRRIIKKKKTPHPPPPPPDAPPPSLFFFFFSSRRRHTRFLYVSWARRCV